MGLFIDMTKSKDNKLNDLEGREWIKFTKSWFIHRPPQRSDKKILHPASFPETLIADFIRFFTKKGQTVMDPFLGSGSTLIAAKMTGRNAIGIELSKKYVDISKKRLQDQPSLLKTKQTIFCANSLDLDKLWEKENLPKIDFCITSPPYWNQLKRSNIRQAERKEKGLDTKYSENSSDIGNIENYEQFLEEQKKIFEKVYSITKSGGYLVIITNNVFADGRMYPLAFDTVRTISNTWVPKDEKVWLQDDKPLLPLGIYNAWVGNRHHQYCLIFRKES